MNRCLLEPQLEEAGGVGGLKAGDRHQAADIRGRDRIAVNLIAVGVEAEAFPQSELVHVGVDVEFEHALVLAALIEAAPIVEWFRVIGAANADAGSWQAPSRIPPTSSLKATSSGMPFGVSGTSQLALAATGTRKLISIAAARVLTRAPARRISATRRRP